MKIVSTGGPTLGQTIDASPNISVGEEYHVLSILIVDEAPSVASRLLQILNRDGDPVWWPAVMFETVSSRIPSNWTVQLWPDGSLHFAPEAWLRRGYWEKYFDNQREGEAVETFRRELEIILREG